MNVPKKIIDARNDQNGNIASVLLEGNVRFTSIETAINMTNRGTIDAVVVNPQNRNAYLRTKPDGKKKNNLNQLAIENSGK